MNKKSTKEKKQPGAGDKQTGDTGETGKAQNQEKAQENERKSQVRPRNRGREITAAVDAIIESRSAGR